MPSLAYRRKYIIRSLNLDEAKEFAGEFSAFSTGREERIRQKKLRK